jgi:general secretion pathway protein G
MLVVVAIIGILAALVSKVAATALERGRMSRCASQLRQLAIANQAYADENRTYVPAAADLNGKNLQRWHGARKSKKAPFDGKLGPLAPYLGTSGETLRVCPSLKIQAGAAAAGGFEASCGGYGYNSVGVGSQTYLMGMKSKATERGMRPAQIQDPSKTVMFTDTAFPQPYGSSPRYVIEYSFAEPYHWVFNPGVESGFRADPSTHFRHGGRANVVWCDGHVSAERLETRAEEHFTRWKVGWFGPADNSLFDPY